MLVPIIASYHASDNHIVGSLIDIMNRTS